MSYPHRFAYLSLKVLLYLYMPLSPVEEIKAKLNILDIIREVVPLAKAGANWKGLCPFHTEKSPSFMVSEEKQFWHCFGCGESGDIFEFIKKHESVDFFEALKLLAARAGVILARFDPQIQNEKTRLLKILESAGKYFQAELRKKEHEHVFSYVRSRNISEHTIELFSLGYAPNNFHGLTNFLRAKNFSEQEVIKTGLLSQRDDRTYFDRFRARVMFPIRDQQGNIVGFTGRLLPGDESPAGKYVNTPTTALYDKSRVLYNLNLAKTQIKKQDYVIVVEGQMDVIQAFQAGTQNVVAASGTALTEFQLETLRRFTKNIMLAFDEDSAGARATERGVDLALSKGFSIKIIHLPHGKDPDDCIRENRDNWFDAIRAAKPYMEHFFEITFKQIDSDNIEHKKRATDLFLQKIALLENAVERDHWFRELGARLHIGDEALRERFLQFFHPEKKREMVKDSETVPKILSSKELRTRIEEQVLALAFSESAFLEFLLKQAVPEDFSETYQNLYKRAMICYNELQPFVFSEWKKVFFAGVSKEEQAQIDILNLLFSKDFEAFESRLRQHEIEMGFSFLKRLSLKESLRNLTQKIQMLERDGKKEEVQALLFEFQQLTQKMRDNI